jgi:hypothetical protein
MLFNSSGMLLSILRRPDCLECVVGSQQAGAWTMGSMTLPEMRERLKILYEVKASYGCNDTHPEYKKIVIAIQCLKSSIEAAEEEWKKINKK